MTKLFTPLWVFSSLLLFLYSFTQVDLSLTFSRASLFQTIQKGFTYVGWFDRPLSTYLYIAVFTILFLLYFWTLSLVKKNLVSRKTIWVTIFCIGGILTLSYNAFSYDMFNYIFDAKIITHYSQNPYLHKALDFPGDPMLSFMRWTHRTYPYGPFWLVLTVPLSFIGNGFFILTFYLFKILMTLSFLLTIYSIEKIAQILKLKNTLLPLAAFAFNPFILSESLVSAHNDIVMMGLCMYGTYKLLDGEIIKGTVFYLLSVGVKFATALLLVVYLVLSSIKKKDYFIAISVLSMIVAVIIATLRTNFQPWYLLYIAPFAAILFEKSYIKTPFIILSVAAVIYYIPFIYTGNWDPPIPAILNNIMLTAISVSLLSIVVERFMGKRRG